MSTQLIKPNYLVILPPTQHHSFFRNLPPLSIKGFFVSIPFPIVLGKGFKPFMETLRELQHDPLLPLDFLVTCTDFDCGINKFLLHLQSDAYLHDFVHQCWEVGAFKGLLSTGHLIQYAAKSPNVTLVIIFFTFTLKIKKYH